MPFSDTDRCLFHVVLIKEKGGKGEMFQRRQIAPRIGAVTWAQGCRLVQFGMWAIAIDKFPGFVDIELEPLPIPRPWSADTLGAFMSVQDLERIARELANIYGTAEVAP